MDRSSANDQHSNDSALEVIEQYVSKVRDYSSQYGSERGFSYAAINIIGRPIHYPLYGDYVATYTPRTYGPWWQDEYAVCPPIAPHHASSSIPSNDFIEVEYEKPVFPTKISIYETYNPGSVVRIWGGNAQGRWQLLFESEPCYVGHHSRIFSPRLCTAIFPVKAIRLDINSSLSDYYPEFDAVLLTGTVEQTAVSPQPVKLKSLDITQKVTVLGLHLIPNLDVMTTWKRLEENLQNWKETVSLDLKPIHHSESSGFSFEDLPVEVIRHILGFLDLRSLCTMARTSRTVKEAASDPLLYSAVNLWSYWSVVTNSTLQWLATKSAHLQRLDLSWCGQNNKICPTQFQNFLANYGTKLKVLRLNNCRFLTEDCLRTLSRCCPLLEVLDLDGLEANTSAFRAVSSLTSLRRLILDRSTIETRALVVILEKNPKLEFLSIDSCMYLLHMDDICLTLQQRNPHLKVLNAWRAKNLTGMGMAALSTLRMLQDLDLGWCLGLPANGGSGLCSLISSLPHLRKLFLTAVRVVTDTDLTIIATYCKDLELLDILGSSSVTPAAVYKVLCNCQMLKLLDVSYCDLIQEDHVIDWREQFSPVAIKYSISPEIVNMPGGVYL